MNIKESIQNRSALLYDVSEKIWEYAEVAFEERQSAALLCDVLEQEGFRVTRNAGNIETAFVAEYGAGKPVIGLCAEYDALAGLSQKVETKRAPRIEGAAGHGCAHNLLGAGALAAALAVRDVLKETGMPGTVRLFGTPGEESLLGKPRMVQAGLFEGTDAVLGWHPGYVNAVKENSYAAMCSVKFHYKGISAHAAGEPYNGRSALDAVELLNISANYLREHILPGSTLHYAPDIKPFPPNIVPDTASVWYFVRAKEARTVKSILDRLVRCANAASEMTDTTCQTEFLGGCYDYLANRTLEAVLYEELEKADPIVYTDEDRQFVEEMTKELPNVLDATRNLIKACYDGEDCSDKIMCEFVCPLSEKLRKTQIPASQDIGDVSYVVPTAQLETPCYSFAAAAHSWAVTAFSNHSYGKKGMLKAGEILGSTVLRLMQTPDVIEVAKAELKRKTANNQYIPLDPQCK